MHVVARALRYLRRPVLTFLLQVVKDMSKEVSVKPWLEMIRQLIIVLTGVSYTLRLDYHCWV